jgi:signal transduction histidine kinase
MKLTYTRTLARRISFAFLGFIIILSVVALFVRDSINDKLNKISQVSKDIENNRAEPEKLLLLLHKADDDFQQSLVKNNKDLKATYRQEISLAFNKIDTLLHKQVSDTSNLTPPERVRMKYWYQQKVSLSGRLYSLRLNFDSLLTAYASVDSIGLAKTTIPSPNLQFKKAEIINKSNAKNKAATKRGLIERIKDAINNKDGNSTMHQQDAKETNAKALKVIKQNQLAYNKALKQLQQQNAKIQQQNVKQLHTQRQLVTTNSYIVNELGNLISQVKDINYNMADEFKSMALKSYQDSTTQLNKLYLTALCLLAVFSALLIVFITQLHQSEVLLREEIESSVAIAQEKMDLLHHMSHEVRTPLTSIMGFLYIFSKSDMTPKQAEMLESIQLSSDMVLRTLNDTLDAAKMEHSELVIYPEPFNPDYILSTVIESMGPIATKKKLYLKYNFIGNKNALIVGDSFRLKQIVVNLLSNAIKYTQDGSVTVNAQLLANDTRLQVEVTDTGDGISREQQAGLFSKYYQTSSSKGQVGTGLGLFICKQLIKLQNGRISVKSELGKGTTFTFYIPYQKKEKNQPVVVGSH